MNQRLIAAFVAGLAGLALVAYVAIAKLPYAYYTTGATVNVLGQNENGASILQVVGHRTYPDDGDLRMTYISVSRPSADQNDKDGSDAWLTGFVALQAWFDPNMAVLPYADVHPPGEDAATSEQQGVQQMNTSQDDAIAVALTELGYQVPNYPKVAEVAAGAPADGKLQVGDVITSVDGAKLDEKTASDKLKTLSARIAASKPGRAVRLGVDRDGVAKQVSVTPRVLDGDGSTPRVGISLAVGYKFPFQVSININPGIGGPSAGLMFSLAVYDYLTPGSLTGGHNIAGTGEIYPDGQVGPIGGIAEKIATARQDGVQLYFVPQDNCADALAAHNAGSMRLVRATSMHEALGALQTYVSDPSAPLPSCQDAPT